MTQQEINDLVVLVVNTTIKTLEDKKLLAPSTKQEKTAYQKTEQLLYNYTGFKRIIREREQEIDDLRKYGVPKKSKSITQYGGVSGTVQQMILPEESVESAVRTVQASVQGIVQIVTLIDNSMAMLQHDPYYKILERYYFEGRTLEDIGLDFGSSQKTMSINKSRLVKELALLIFPDQVISEMMA